MYVRGLNVLPLAVNLHDVSGVTVVKITAAETSLLKELSVAKIFLASGLV